MAIALDTLAYARRLREAGFSEQQAEGQAQALAAAMTDTLATKQDLRELELRIDARFTGVDAHFTGIDARFTAIDARFTAIDARFESLEKHLDIRIDELEKRIAIRFQEHTAHFRSEIFGLEHRMTVRLGGITVAGIGVVSALVKML